MAKQSNVNSIPADGSFAMYIMKEVLKAAGWVVNQSSDGTTYNAAGDQITSGGAGAGGMGNANAWFEIQEPEVNGRSYTVQRVSSDRNYRVKLSTATGFSGGTPGATQTPSATDEEILFGGGTDAAPTGSNWLPADGTYRIHAIAQDSPVGPAGNRCYGFWFFTTETGTGAFSFAWCQLPLAVGSYPVLSGTRTAPTDGEPDPAVYITVFTSDWANFDGNGWSDNNRGLITPRGWWKYANPQGDPSSFLGQRVVKLEVQTNFGYLLTRNVGTSFGVDVSFPIYFANSAFESTTGPTFKGVAQYLRVAGTNRGYPDTINVATDAYVYVDDLLIPWEDNTAPLL